MWLASLTDQQRDALLGLAHDVVVSDGLLDPNEEDMLIEFRREMAKTPDSGADTDYLELDGIGEVFNTRRARVVAVLNLLHLSYADGVFDVEEECLLREVARAFDIGDEDFRLMDNWVKRLVALEEEACGMMRP